MRWYPELDRWALGLSASHESRCIVLRQKHFGRAAHGFKAREADALLRSVTTLLAERYRTPRLGNKRHPVSELVFIVLSVRTRGREHERVYRRLRKAFGCWEAVRDAGTGAIYAQIRDAGLGRVKARQIKRLLQALTDDLGSLSGVSLRRLSTADLEAYLLGLPGVGLKTARCVMLYAFGRDVFPVDTHCMRLFENLGLIDARLRFDVAQDPLQEVVAPDLRYALHVNAVAHGRETCIPGAPKCIGCPITSLCRNRREAA